MNASLTLVEMVAPVWIDLTCLCVNARLATAVQYVTLMYVYTFLLRYSTYSSILQTFKQTSNEVNPELKQKILKQTDTANVNTKCS